MRERCLKISARFLFVKLYLLSLLCSALTFSIIIFPAGGIVFILNKLRLVLQSALAKSWALLVPTNRQRVPLVPAQKTAGENHFQMHKGKTGVLYLLHISNYGFCWKRPPTQSFHTFVFAPQDCMRRVMWYISLSGFISWILSCKSEEMAFLAVNVLIGIFIYFSSVKGSSQPQARVFLTFNGKKEDKHS